MKIQQLGIVDRRLFFAGLGLATVSAMAMASAARTVSPVLALRHDAWIFGGILISCVVANTDYRRWTEIAWIAYGISLVALILVLIAGPTRLGATRWLSVWGISLQPSELAKLTTIWLLASLLAGYSAPLPGRTLLMSFILIGPPMLLVFIQPDLGSASIFVAIWFGMVWIAGMSWRVVAALGAGAMALLPIGWHLLQDYQRDRLMAFFDPYADPLGAGYTIIQSIIAIGSGQLCGRGWFAGTQHQLSFLPEHHSDFIFAVIGEEWGLLGCFVVVALFLLLLWRTADLATTTSNPHGRLVAAGVFSWIAYQAFVNMAMVMGLLPVVGVPLPLVSYGGSSMVALWIALGLLQSIARSERLE